MKGGLHVGADRCVHTHFTHNPSTLRLASQDPNMQNIPREGPVRNMFVAPQGYTFWARDYAGIEALLVGYLAHSARYQRLARLDIHSFFTAHALYELDKSLQASDLPQESWDDATLAAALAELKSRFKPQRECNKRLVHGGNYLMGPFEAQEVLLLQLGSVVPIKDIKRLYGVYWELFPEIPRWHRRVTGLEWAKDRAFDHHRVGEQEAAYQCGYLRTHFGNIHEYYDVLNWVKGPKGWEARYGSDAKRAVAFLPQSSARFILTRAAQRLDSAVQDTLRLFVHDEMLGLCRTNELEHCLHESQVEMERPVSELEGLIVGTEAKAGSVWGEMRKCL